MRGAGRWSRRWPGTTRGARRWRVPLGLRAHEACRARPCPRRVLHVPWGVCGLRRVCGCSPCRWRRLAWTSVPPGSGERRPGVGGAVDSDEVGYVSEAVIQEIAQRLDLFDLEVRSVLSYYTMLRTKPAGTFNIQVCTNISCMLRGGYEILDHCKKKLGIGHKQVTPDGQFSLEEVECIGACCWAPAMQVNYDFHDDLTPAKVDEILADYATKDGK